MKNKMVCLLLMTVTILIFSKSVYGAVVPGKWNYHATYDFDLLENNSRVSAVRIISHTNDNAVNIDTNNDGAPEYSFTLNIGDMWEKDLPTGAHIWSEQELTVHQYDDRPWDFEQVILPAVRYWNNDYYYGGILSLGYGENYILITAAHDNTYVVIDENNDGAPEKTRTLNAGEVWIYSKPATILEGESLPMGYPVGYDTRAGAHIYTTTDDGFTMPGGNPIQVHAFAEMSEYWGSAYNIIPTSSLGKEYIFPRVDTVEEPLYFDRADKMIFVATKPDTTVTIDKDHDGITDVTITLVNSGDWDYWPYGSIDNAWAHGAYVSANEAIVAFYSSPGGGRYWDGFMSQMVPKMASRSEYWNSNGMYTINSLPTTPYIHFFAYEDGTTLYRDINNDGEADFTYNLNFNDGGLEIAATKEGEHFWLEDPANHHVTMYQRIYYIASDSMSPISYQINPEQIPPKVISVTIDIKPGSCPNPINTKSRGVLPVAVLGTGDFDVSQIEPSTIRLSRQDNGTTIGGNVMPLRYSYEDVATPFNPEEEGCCNDLDGDGFEDLSLKFNTQELVEDLVLKDVTGETVFLILTGNLKDEEEGMPIKGQDCVWILDK